MTYCLGIVTQIWPGHGLGFPHQRGIRPGQCLPEDVHLLPRRRTRFHHAGQREPVLHAIGRSPSCNAISIRAKDWPRPSLYDAARVVGNEIRRVGDMDRPALERDDYKFNVHFLLGGQVRGEQPGLFLVYPQGNPLQATEESPYLQVGETKYGRPILDRGIRYEKTSLEEAGKYALLSLDSTMKSNVTVGPPIDLLAYETDQLTVTHQRRFDADDPDLRKIAQRWQAALRVSGAALAQYSFRVTSTAE